MGERYPNFRRAQREGGPFRKRPTEPAPPRSRGTGFAVRVAAASLAVAAGTWVLTPPSPSIARETQKFAESARRSVEERSTYYPNCDAARAAGAAPLHRGQPGYREPLDRDGDGVACEPYRDRTGRWVR